jgi:hypothetical protein
VALQSIASLDLRHPVPTRLAVGCLDGGADMCAQLWVSKAQVGGGGGLKLAVAEGRVRPHQGCEHRSGYAIRALERRLLLFAPAKLTGYCQHGRRRSRCKDCGTR